MSKTIENPSASAVVRDSIRRAILSGELEAGQQLAQEDLARRFEVSRIPVREALRQLESEGLVTYKTNRGAVVSSPTLAEIIEMFDIRSALECRAFRLAIPNMTEMDIERARQVLNLYDTEPDVERWSEMNWEFHSILYLPCDRPRLLALIDANYSNVGRFTRVFVSQTSGRDRPQKEHYELLDLASRHETDQAVKLLEDHIFYSQKIVQASFRNRQRQQDS